MIEINVKEIVGKIIKGKVTCQENVVFIQKWKKKRSLLREKKKL